MFFISLHKNKQTVLNPKLVISKLISSELVKNSSKLLSANILAQAIALIVYPVLARMYSPNDFGLMNLFLSIGGILGLISTAEYQYAILLPKSEQKATACLQAGFVCCAIVSAASLLSVCFSVPIAALFDAPNLAKWYWLMPLYVFSTGCWSLLNYWYTRHKRFGAISTYQISQNLLSSGTKVGFGAMGMLSGGLILSSVLAPVFAIGISIKHTYRNTIRPLFLFRKNQVKTCAEEYVKFPKYSLPRALVNNFSGNLPILLLSPFFGMSEIGFFGMAMTLAFRPMNMISTSLYQVFFQRTAERVQQKESIKPFFVKFIRNTLLIAVPSFALLYFILPWLTTFFLGSGWDSTATYIRMMLPWLALFCILSPISYIADIFQKQNTYLLFDIVLFIIRSLALSIGIFMQNIHLAILGYFIGGTIINAVQLLWFLNIVNKYEKERLQTIH
ncbi:MAG: oligosaccharide flippase family protein [Paludibacteraceae bacterium]|nr:oligosaccharide flippase family protein [Paludibacteraceae bacterium]MBR6309611.1 oligosaccharide flippase family protein [Paludibacteraceae bacterium]MDD6357070.1 oligosaccharide flippase family protein [Bacteroidales bacterium]